MSEPWETPAVVRHTRRLIDSHRHWTGRELLAASPGFTLDGEPAAIARLVYELPYVVVSHADGADPIFNYGNRCAQILWELDWEHFTRLPSRRSAEPVHVDERQRWLDTAARQGYVEGCHGVRVSARGRRFRISDVTIWNVIDEAGSPCGQAATYRTWSFLGEAP